MIPIKYDPNTIQHRLFTVRKRLNLTQPEFAESIRMPTRSYKNYEIGLRPLPLSMLRAINSEYSISLNWLVNGEGPMHDVDPAILAETAVVSVQNYLSEHQVTLSAEKLGRVVKHLVGYLVKYGSLSEDYTKDYLKSFLSRA
jgi:transcriptional regulator with XRE-family HTH domain